MKRIIFLLVFLFSINFAYSLGCCVDLLSGTCSPNSEQSSCSNGIFENDATCSSVSECDFGCCTIALDNRYLRESSCYLLGEAAGIPPVWEKTDAETCANKGNLGQIGACVIKTSFDTKCTYGTAASCIGGTFYQNTYCSNPSLNTTCKKTEYTTCNNESVHYIDTCGNVDEKKETCDYDQGTICAKKSSTESYCKNLNCVDNQINIGEPWKNGESWCVRPIDLIDPAKQEALMIGENTDLVGGRYYRQYCLNGEIITEPCADYRMEMCKTVEGAAKCVLTEGAMCNAANLEEINPETGLSYDPEVCTEDNGCQVMQLKGWDNAFAAHTVRDDLARDVGMDYCVPLKGWVNTGYEVGEEDPRCEVASYKAAIYFDHSTGEERWEIAKDFEGSEFQNNSYQEYGKAGLLGLTDGAWTRYQKFNDLAWQNISSDKEIPTKRAIDLIAFRGDSKIYLLEEHPLYLFAETLIGTTKTTGRSAYTISGNPFAGDWHDNQYQKFINTIEDAESNKIIPEVVIWNEHLGYMCDGSGDCGRDKNWVGAFGTGIMIQKGFNCRKAENGRSDQVLCTFEFTCGGWQPPASGQCSLCGQKGLPCSEYRCEALGKNCEYSEPAGAEKGYCVEKTDGTPPAISHSLNPPSPVPPFSSVEITISTNEESYCRFNLEESSSKFEDMDYEVDEQWSTEHKMIFNVPGKKPTIENEDLPQYDLIKDDGNYKLFVRCQDPAGNWNLAPYIINFEVMQTPDSIPPAILNFTPRSGSPVKVNETQKIVQLKLNEPAECRWSFQDKEFLLMENNMSCDTDISDYGVLNGYFCSALFTNIDQNITNQTKYYIRCKDQPWLEGKEDEYYKRNTNPSSKEYFIRPSTQLNIIDITPKDYLLVGPATTNLTLNARTEGGSESGKAECMWRFTINGITTGYKKFLNTNSATHSETITNKTEGDYIFEVRCTDSAGNVAVKNQSLQMRYDSSAPYITRTYNDKGTLKISTDEPATCKFMKMTQAIDCLFPFGNQNATQMSGKTSLQHVTNFVKGTTYLIKCQDFYSNTNTLCGITAKATN